MLNRPLWAEVSSHRLLANYKKLRRIAGPRAEVGDPVTFAEFRNGVAFFRKNQ